MNIDLSQLPEPLPAEADPKVPSIPNPFVVTPQTQPVVNDLGQQFDLSSLPEPLPAEETTTRGTLADMGVAAAHGVESAVREGVKTAGDMALHTIVPPFMRDVVKDFVTSHTPNELTPKPETTIGKIESDLIRFGLGFLTGGQLIKGAGVAANMAKSAVGTGLVADPQAERLSNIIENYPSLKNPITDYLAASHDDSAAEGKFKAAVEDVLTNSVAQLAFKTMKVAKGALSGKATEADTSSMAEDLLKTGKPASATHTVDPLIKAEQARQAITPEWAPLKISDEKAIQFKEKLDAMFKDKSIEATPKADGSISVAHMDSSPQILNTVRELAELVEPEMKAAGFTAHQSQLATKELADNLLMEPEILIGALKAAGATADSLAPQILAGRMMIQGLAANVAKQTERALLTGEGKEAAIAEIKRFVEIQSSFKSLQTGVARGLQIFGAKAGQVPVDDLATALAGKDGDELLKVFSMAEGDPTAISRLANAIQTTGLRKAIDTHNEIWINALLSSPKTQMVNIASTSLNMLVQPLNLVVGGTIRREWSDVREGVALYVGLKQHLFDAMHMARKAWQVEGPILSPVTTNEIKPAISSTSYNLDPDSILGQAVDFTGKYLVRWPGRLLTTGDEFFKQLAYRSKLSAQAAREGMDLVKAGKLSQEDLGEWMDDRIAKGFNQAGAALDEKALAYADRATFTTDLKTETWLGNRSFGESSQTLASTHPVLRGTILPFVRVPANLARQVIDYTPGVAQLHKRFWSDIEAGGTRRTEAIGKLSLGSSLWMGAALLANEGLITGAAPQDKELREALLATGWQPYSVKIGGQYVSYNRLDPFASVLGLVADYTQISGHLPENKRDELASIMTLSLVNNLASKSYLKGLIDTLTIVGSSDPNKIHRWIQQRSASYIPAAVASLNPDREMKEARSVVDAMLTKIPGLSATVEAKRDFFGEKKLMPGHFPYTAFSPFPSTVESTDPVRKELARLAMSDAQAQFNTPPAHIGNVDLTAFKNAKGQTAYDRYQELIGTVTDGAGRTMHQAMLDKINSDAYKRGSDGDSWYTVGSRVSMLRVVHDHFKDRALMTLKREMPELAERLRQDKQNRLAVKKGREKVNPMEALLSSTK